MNIQTVITDITNDIETLSNKRNVGEISKMYTSIDKKIKNAQTKIQKLKANFTTNDTEINELTQNEYTKYITDLSDNQIEAVLNCTELEDQINQYKELNSKIKSCIQYLENKKMIIVECDKDEPKVEEVSKKKNKKIEN